MIVVSWAASKINSTPFKSTAAEKSANTIYKFYPNAAAIAVENATVAALAEVINVPDSLGSVIVLSAVGSTTVNVVSYSSAVAPSNIILASVKAKAVAVKVVIVGELIVGLVKVLLV